MIESSLQRSESVSLPPMRPFGRVVRSVTGYGVATALMLVSPLLVFAPAALFHCALRNGRRAVFAAAIIAVILTGIYFAQAANVSTSESARGLAYASYGFLVLSVTVPSLAAVPLVLRGERFGRVLALTLAGGAFGLGILELTMRVVAGVSPYALQMAKMQQNAASIVEMYRAAGAGADFIRTAQTVLRYFLNALPAGILMDLALMFVLSLMMFGRIRAWRSAEEPRLYLFRELVLPDWLLFAFVFGGLTPLATGTLQQVAANVLAITVFLYILQGLAIFRFMLIRAGAGVFGNILGFSILAMLCIAGIGVLAMAMAGLFDPFFDFRKLKQRKDDSHESHTD